MSALRDALRDLPDGVFFDLLESEDDYVLVLDVPGVPADTVEFAVEDERIVIEARREKTVPDDYEYIEENRSLFLDVELPLPDDATSEGTDASVERGVLTARLPKDDRPETTIDVVEDEGD